MNSRHLFSTTSVSPILVDLKLLCALNHQATHPQSLIPSVALGPSCLTAQVTANAERSEHCNCSPISVLLLGLMKNTQIILKAARWDASSSRDESWDSGGRSSLGSKVPSWPERWSLIRRSYLLCSWKASGMLGVKIPCHEEERPRRREAAGRSPLQRAISSSCVSAVWLFPDILLQNITYCRNNVICSHTWYFLTQTLWKPLRDTALRSSLLVRVCSTQCFHSLWEVSICS